MKRKNGIFVIIIGINIFVWSLLGNLLTFDWTNATLDMVSQNPFIFSLTIFISFIGILFITMGCSLIDKKQKTKKEM